MVFTCKLVRAPFFIGPSKALSGLAIFESFNLRCLRMVSLHQICRF